jgi:hypothetical protein
MARPTAHQLMTLLTGAAVLMGGLVMSPVAASAKTCAELRSLCWTMRDDKSDCAKPYQRCLNTGVFVTPLGRRFKATGN